MKHIIYIILFLISFNGVAQDKALIDSLIIELSIATADTTKLILEKELEEAKRNERIPYWDSLLVRAAKIGFQRIEAEALNNLGFFYDQQSEISKAIKA